MRSHLHKLTVLILAATAGSGAALADESVAVGTSGALERAGQTQDALKNGTAASFGSPVTDDRRLFKLRWRMPWLLAGGAGLGPAPFVSGFTATSVAVPGGLSLAAEPTNGGGLSSLIPELSLGEPHKLGNVQFGALSATVGHGTLVDRYTNSPDGAVRSPGLLLEGNLAGLGAAVMTANTLAMTSSLAAARVYGRPIMWFTAPDATFQPNELDVDPRTEVAGIWVIGVSGVVDPQAPSTGGRGPQNAWAAGVDNEAALLDNQLVKTIGYVDVNALGAANPRRSPGLGVHPGVNLMLDAAGFRFDSNTELNFGTDDYVPRYFDRLYELERSKVFGADKPKLDIDRPGSWGWQGRASAGYMEMVTAFVESHDQMPYDSARGQHSGAITVGASAFVFFLGASVTATQTGITDYANPHFLGPGFVVTAEGRVALVANTIHLVGRWWRAHEPAGDSPDDYVINEGSTLGVELNFDFL